MNLPLFVIAPTYQAAVAYVYSLPEHPGRWRYYHPDDRWKLRGAGPDALVVEVSA